jgi:hypothetical protein
MSRAFCTSMEDPTLSRAPAWMTRSQASARRAGAERGTMITAVLFDLDDTLFDHRGCAREALAAVQGCHDRFRSMPFEALERAHARFLEELHVEVMLGRMPLEAARIERFRRLLEALRAPSGDGLATRIAATYRDTTARHAERSPARQPYSPRSRPMRPSPSSPIICARNNWRNCGRAGSRRLSMRWSCRKRRGLQSRIRRSSGWRSIGLTRRLRMP